MTTQNLKAWSKKQLEDLARKRKVKGWQEMTKAELVAALSGT